MKIKNYINGKFLEPVSDNWIDNYNPATGEVLAENPDFIKNGDAAIVKIKPVQPMVIETQKEIPQLSRFAVRDSGQTVAAGMCIDLVKKA